MKRIDVLIYIFVAGILSVNCWASGIALIVVNASNLGDEEKAAYDFALSVNQSITAVDADMAKRNHSLLSAFGGYWADTSKIPSEWNDTLLLQALESELLKGKKLLAMSLGNYIIQYLGYGTVQVSSWCPTVNDEVYLVNYTEGVHPAFAGLNRWNPLNETDDPEQLIWRVDEPRYWTAYSLTPSGNHTEYVATVLATRYGYCCPERYLTNSTFFTEIPVGGGVIMTGPPALTRDWRYKQMGERLLRNQISWAG